MHEKWGPAMIRLRTIALAMTVAAVAVTGCNAMGGTRVKSVTPSWGAYGNLLLRVYHGGGNPRSVEMRFYLDGTALGQPQRIRRGCPSLRNVIYAIRIQVPPGEHVLRAEVAGQDIAAEKKFTVDDAATDFYGLVTYEQQGKDVPKLELQFAATPLIGFV